MLTLISSEAPASRSFEELRDCGRQAAESGRLEEALSLFDAALEVARAEGSEPLIDLAYCNRSAVLITLGRQGEVQSRLRQILVKNRDTENCLLAAYNLSRVHGRDKQTKKALFYARIARDRALALGIDDWLVASYMQLANCLVDDSYFDQAAKDYRRALALQTDEPSVPRAMVLANLGYCLMMLGDLKQGFTLAFRALRWFRRFGAQVYEVWPRVDLCYAYLESGRTTRARQHGLRALELAQSIGDPVVTKMSLFLLGETAKAAGDEGAAYEYFSRLQTEFYPDSPEIAGLMVTVGMRQIVNLRA